MPTLGLILLILALLLALIASRIPTVGSWQLFPLSFAVFVLALVFGGLKLP